MRKCSPSLVSLPNGDCMVDKRATAMGGNDVIRGDRFELDMVLENAGVELLTEGGICSLQWL